MRFALSGLDKLGVFGGSRTKMTFIQKTVVTEIGAEELVVLVLLVGRGGLLGWFGGGVEGLVLGDFGW